MIGDVLTSSLLCEALKVRFGKSELHYLINAHTSAVLDNNPYIDKQIIYTPEMEESVSLRSGLNTSLQQENYDLVIDVYSKLGSAFMVRATEAPLRIGYKKWYTKWAYTHTYTYDKQPKTEAGLAIENRMKLLEPLGLDFSSFLKPKIYLTDKERAQAQAVLTRAGIKGNQKLLMISLLGSSAEKTYPLPYMAKVLDHIAATTSCQLLLNYIPKQQQVVNELLTLVNKKTKDAIFDTIYGKSLREFLALTSCCAGMIGNEGGAINMAKALDIPTFSIFSPWIRREAWGLFENEQNVSVHLKDILPEVYKTMSLEKIRKAANTYYKKLLPDFVNKKLTVFLDKIATS